MEKFKEGLIQFFIPGKLSSRERQRAIMLCLTSPVIGLLAILVFLFPPEPDEILVGFGLFGSLLLLSIPFVLKFLENYKIASGVFTSVCLALFPLCLFEYGGLLSPVLFWVPLMPILLGYLLGWKEGASISILLCLELLALYFVNSSNPGLTIGQIDAMGVNTITALLAIGAGILLSFKLDTKKKDKEDELSDTQNSLEEALRAKELFWNNISHEIRTPLNGILGMTQVLLEGKSTDEQQELLKIIRESGVHLKAVLNDVVDYSQLELGDLKLKKEPFLVEDSLTKIISMFDDYLTEKNIQLTFEIHRYFPEALLTDSYRVKQILIHLVSNAIKFTNTGFVKIRAEVTDHENVFQFSVTDSGKGIKKQSHSKIFSTFYQGDLSATREHGGAGLGLALCKRLVELLGGNIDFESTEGRGSHFYFNIQAMPLDLSQDLKPTENQVLTPALTEFYLSRRASKTQKKKDSGLLTPNGLRTLVAEDNSLNLTLMETLLKQLGHQVDLAVNGNEALQQIEKNEYDIVFMDIQMPIMDGITCTKKILELYGEDSPAIIAVTANVQQREECISLGMDDFIGKPINVNKIKQALNKIYQDSFESNTDESSFQEVEASYSHPREDFIHEDSIQVFNRKAFLENFSNDLDLIEFLIIQFKDTAPRVLREIDLALQNNDPVKLESAAHSLKGALSNFFCLELRQMAHQLELMAQKKDFETALGIYIELKSNTEVLQLELEESFINKKAAG